MRRPARRPRALRGAPRRRPDRPRDPLLQRMIEVQEQHGGSVIALMEVAPEQIHLYGCAAVEATAEGDVVRISGLVEKPDPADAPPTTRSSAAMCWPRRSSTCCARPSRAAAARSS
ncbi:protein of unknown function [Streptomyces murinus]